MSGENEADGETIHIHCHIFFGFTSVLDELFRMNLTHNGIFKNQSFFKRNKDFLSITLYTQYPINQILASFTVFIVH